tara:strand:+ start:62 stop:769 length:708 start_codon:yes stop_codon:yes gene_type:complete
MIATDECKQCGGTGWLGYETTSNGSVKFNKCKCQQARQIDILLGNPDIVGLTESDVLTFTFRSFKPTRQAIPIAQNQAKAMVKVYKNWVSKKHIFLTVSGSTGIGKTHLAKAAIVELIKKGERPFYSRAVELNRQLRNFEDGEADRYRDRLTTSPYLVLDDVGVEHDPRGYLQSIYHGVIDDRYSNNSPTLVVTNLALDRSKKHSLANAIGVRAVSRLNSGQFFEMRGKDLRGEL